MVKFSNARNRLSLFILDNKEGKTFHLYNNNDKLSLLLFLHAVTNVDVLTASNKDVKPVETRTVHLVSF